MGNRRAHQKENAKHRDYYLLNKNPSFRSLPLCIVKLKWVFHIRDHKTQNSQKVFRHQILLKPLSNTLMPIFLPAGTAGLAVSLFDSENN